MNQPGLLVSSSLCFFLGTVTEKSCPRLFCSGKEEDGGTDGDNEGNIKSKEENGGRNKGRGCDIKVYEMALVIMFEQINKKINGYL